MDIRITNLTKQFDGRIVLNHFSAVFPEGKATCIMGPSGCGKTTLIRILLGLVRPDSGTLEGIPSKISAVFQEDRLLPGFSVLTNVTLGDSKKDSLAVKILEELGLEQDLNRKAGELSGGMKRRVAIARALVFSGDLFVLDEGFKGLDEQTREMTIQTVKKYTFEKTLILVTHDIAETGYFTGHLIRMKGGFTE